MKNTVKKSKSLIKSKSNSIEKSLTNTIEKERAEFFSKRCDYNEQDIKYFKNQNFNFSHENKFSTSPITCDNVVNSSDLTFKYSDE